MRISDWSSDVCSSDLHTAAVGGQRVLQGVDGLRRVELRQGRFGEPAEGQIVVAQVIGQADAHRRASPLFERRFLPAPVLPTAVLSAPIRSEEHTSELQSLMRRAYAVFCLNNKNNN